MDHRVGSAVSRISGVIDGLILPTLTSRVPDATIVMLEHRAAEKCAIARCLGKSVLTSSQYPIPAVLGRPE